MQTHQDLPYAVPAACLLAVGLLSSPVAAQVAPIRDALLEVGEEVRIYDEHITILAHPFMEGRVPGSRGMELAKEYMEWGFRQAGLEGPYPDGELDHGSFRQPFPLGKEVTIVGQAMSLYVDGKTIEFTGGEDFEMTGMGPGGAITAEATFVGYSIEEGPDAYATYGEEDDLTGRIAVMLRFEPMDENGDSLWSERGPWSRAAGFAGKIRSAVERNAAGIVIINTPGANDPRVERLSSAASQSRITGRCPVFHVTTECGDRLVRALDAAGRSLMDLRQEADASGRVVSFGDARLTLMGEVEEIPQMAENVIGLLPGKGALAHEYVVMGAHLDHLGMGEFGSRSGPGKLHPGADDNASGSAAVIMLADRMHDTYEALPDDADARSILFMGFSAEESGLNGSRYYANHPLYPIEQHVFMFNFDMIGRITGSRLSVSGMETGLGLREWCQPFFEASPLEIVQPQRMMGASDHSSFARKDIPILFGIIADFHGDYHTPEDTSNKINRVGAVQTIDLFEEMLVEIATQPERFVAPGDEEEETAPARSAIRVRFGIRPGSYDEDGNGIMVAGVTDGSPADEGGIQVGDLMVSWDGQLLESVEDWMPLLRSHAPGDRVKVGIIRDGKEIDIEATLSSRDEAEG